MCLVEIYKNKYLELKQVFPWVPDIVMNDYDKISNFPLITESILEKNYYNNEATGNYYLTSGSSMKRRKKIYYSEEDENRYLEIKSSVFKNFLFSNSYKPKKVLTDVGTGHAANTATIIFDKLGVQNMAISYDLPIKKHIEFIESYKPDILYTMPSILDSIIDNINDISVIAIKKIILVGEIASSNWLKNKVAKVFSIHTNNIMDTYGSIELGFIAYYSHDVSKYVFVDNIIPEGIKETDLGIEDKTVLNDNESILVITSLNRKHFPALRYVTYDVVRELKKIRYNDKYVYSFDSVVKRIGKEFKHGEKISIYDIENVVFKYLSHASIDVYIFNNMLNININTCLKITKHIKNQIFNDIQSVIPEISSMIKNGLLKEIKVLYNAKDKKLYNGIKKKKIICQG